MMDKDILELRHRLHANPDLSNHEDKTAAIIKDFIASFRPTEIIEGIGGCGLAAVYRFSEKGPTITLRCELDALPIKESNSFAHKSTKTGVSHKCGHDGHMAIVASIAKWLNQNPLKNGTVILLFQPAEETGEGAKRIIEDEKFNNLNTDFVFALHNIPKKPKHHIIIPKKGFSAEVLSVIIKLQGKESHASEPENGINPSLGISKIIHQLSSFNIVEPSDTNFAILTPVHINMGQKSYGISPAHGELHYTLRTWNTATMDKLKANLEHVVQTICRQHLLQYDLEWLEHFPASEVDKSCNAIVKKAAIVNGFTFEDKNTPFKFGEDFGWFSKTYKSAMFGVGAGMSTPALHNADYDFPDNLLATGFSMFKSIILNILEKK
ncbi:amidohydrolase [Flagellimonas okinawensis]|uniref:Amidohydrolase n=1 Tax=Flagellimonas okinawensis TaxID=3031324 RepID=A0ABT5XJI9_9FLAO|nr:amidohydrolase [[Muricauda] okinawensis]MDF0706037.1 amidohydrolase [[Muricauda] okinawensis]